MYERKKISDELCVYMCIDMNEAKFFIRKLLGSMSCFFGYLKDNLQGST